MRIYMYVSISAEDKISIFTVNPATGKMSLEYEMEVGGRPAPLAIGPQKTHLHVGRRRDCEISSYEINQNNGSLILKASVTMDSDPNYLATDRKGNFLFSSHFGASKVGVHSLSEDGTVRSPAIQWVDTALGAHSMQTDSSNRFAFVPHIAVSEHSNAIFQFKFDECTGRINLNSPPKVVPEGEVGPRHFCFHPNKDVLYVSNEQGNSVTAYNLDTSLGTLSHMQTVSTIPAGWKGKSSSAQIQITSTGKCLYAPNRGHNSIACFSVDSFTGHLKFVGHVFTEPVPRAFSVDPQGKFLFVAGLESGRLASYRIDQNTGGLEPLEIVSVGREPMWVLLTTLD